MRVKPNSALPKDLNDAGRRVLGELVDPTYTLWGTIFPLDQHELEHNTELPQDEVHKGLVNLKEVGFFTWEGCTLTPTDLLRKRYEVN